MWVFLMMTISFIRIFWETLLPTALERDLPVIYSDVKNVTFEKDNGIGRMEKGFWNNSHTPSISSGTIFLLGNYIPINCLLIRRDCFDDVGLFDEGLSVYEELGPIDSPIS